MTPTKRHISAFLLILLSVTPAYAELSEELLEKKAQIVYGVTMSPFCPGRLLKDCPSTAATDLKHEIKERLSKGETEEQIIASLEEKYGDQVYALPRNDLMGQIAWLTPVAFLILGGIIVGTWLLRKRGVIEEEPVTDDVDPDVARQIEKELADNS